MVKKLTIRPTNPQEIVVFEKSLNHWFLDRLHTKTEKIKVTYLTDNSNASSETKLVQEKFNQYYADRELEDNAYLLSLYKSGKITWIELPLKPVIFPDDKKTKSAVAYLHVSVSSVLDGDNETAHLLDMKVRG
jgi:hypothetical protein